MATEQMNERPTEQDDAPRPFTEAEVRTFAAKLEAWATILPPREQALLAGLCAQAAAAPTGDVQGFLMKDGPIEDQHQNSGPTGVARYSASPTGNLGNDVMLGVLNWTLAHPPPWW